MNPTKEKHYEQLSPFELKDELLSLAQSNASRMMLNAGRGNPNWLATTPRDAFFQLGLFAMQESKRSQTDPAIGAPAKKKDLVDRFNTFITNNQNKSGVAFLKQAVDYTHKELNIERSHFLNQIVDAILGDHYPIPDRIFNFNEKITDAYLKKTMFGGGDYGTFNLFATEGGTAAMTYIFNSLIENKILHKGDTIALGTPIFTPYLEIPQLNEFKFVTIKVKQDRDNQWRYPESELEKLANPKIKAFFLVHPSNPTSVRMHPDSFNTITNLVKTKRDDLIILTDDVYGTFVDGFQSLAAAAPHNTILVYSYSKYFGTTGWRLGVIAIHEDNIFDKKLAALPKEDKKLLHERYKTVTLTPEKLPFIERIVADSRDVALHHTAGLSTPQQVMMALFSLYELVDSNSAYKKKIQAIVHKRYNALYTAIGIDPPQNPLETYYYTIIDIPTLAEHRYGKAFTDYLVTSFEPIDFVMRLAQERSVVLLDGGGFDAPNMSVRVSLANLPDQAYTEIGNAISWLLEEYYKQWQQ